MNKAKNTRWNLWQSKSQKQTWFLKKGDRREKILPKDAHVVKYFISDSYNRVIIKLHRWADRP